MMTRYVNQAFGSCIKYRLKQLGIEPWPRIFHNLRSTRQTELEESFPSHVVAAWLGNSETIARRHYLQVTDGHFAKATQNPTQTISAKTRTDATAADGEAENTLDSRNVSHVGEAGL